MTEQPHNGEHARDAAHRPIKVEYPKGTIFLCARCWGTWPCLEAQAAAIREAQRT